MLKYFALTAVLLQIQIGSAYRGNASKFYWQNTIFVYKRKNRYLSFDWFFQSHRDGL